MRLSIGDSGRDDVQAANNEHAMQSSKPRLQLLLLVGWWGFCCWSEQDNRIERQCHDPNKWSTRDQSTRLAICRCAGSRLPAHPCCLNFDEGGGGQGPSSHNCVRETRNGVIFEVDNGCPWIGKVDETRSVYCEKQSRHRRSPGRKASNTAIGANVVAVDQWQQQLQLQRLVRLCCARMQAAAIGAGCTNGFRFAKFVTKNCLSLAAIRLVFRCIASNDYCQS